MYDRITEQAAIVRLTKKWDLDPTVFFLLAAPLSGYTTDNGKFQAMICNYKASKEIKVDWTIAVYDLNSDRMVDRFNVVS